MANNTPVILMAIANDAQHSLEIAEEERNVRNALAEAHDSERIEFLSLGHSILTDIFSSLNRFNRRISIFHFSGHSNSEGLMLEDGDAESDNLAKIFGMAPELKLVFLNGCSNREQVKVLQKEGVKSIIATSVPIGDKKALELAQQFYQAMASGKTIKEAFDTAKAFLDNKYTDIKLASYRAFVFRREELAVEEFPWGLYYQKESDVNWRLPLPEQMDETLAKEVHSVGGGDMQMDATIEKHRTSIGSVGGLESGMPVIAVELESNDRRVQNASGVLRIDAGALIGRGPECDIVILSPGVSRKHVRIQKNGSRMMFIDQNSTNGIYWNNVRVSQMPILEDGVLRCDDVEFKVKVVFA